jgi:GGDEF domain-containing protein
LRQQTSLQQQLTHQAFHDARTGLANRAQLSERLEPVRDRRQVLNGILWKLSTGAA